MSRVVCLLLSLLICFLVYVVVYRSSFLSSSSSSSSSPSLSQLEVINNACLVQVGNVTKTYNQQHHITSLETIAQLHKNKMSSLPETPPMSLKDAQYRDDGEEKPQLFHVFWEDVTPLAHGCACHACMHKLVVLIRSWLATQDVARSSLIFWAANASALLSEPLLVDLLPYIKIHSYDTHQLAVGTVLEGSPLLDFKDEFAYVQGDLARSLLLYQYGGMWVDADSILLNDFTPLFQREFVARWGSTQKMSVGIIHFFKHSDFLGAVLQSIATSGGNLEHGGYDWGRNTYTRLYHEREKQQKSIPYMYETCYFYPEWLIEGFQDYAMAPEPDEPERPLFLEAFTYHWHGGGGKRFNAPIEPGSQFDRTSRLVNDALVYRFGKQDVAPLISDHGFDPSAPIPWCWTLIAYRATHYILIPIGILITCGAIIQWISPTTIPRVLLMIRTHIIIPTQTWWMGKRRTHAYSAVSTRAQP